MWLVWWAKTSRKTLFIHTVSVSINQLVLIVKGFPVQSNLIDGLYFLDKPLAKKPNWRSIEFTTVFWWFLKKGLWIRKPTDVKYKVDRQPRLSFESFETLPLIFIKRDISSNILLQKRPHHSFPPPKLKLCQIFYNFFNFARVLLCLCQRLNQTEVNETQGPSRPLF